MYEFTIFMLDRGIALVNFIVIYSFYIQMPGLVFHDGITPGKFLQMKDYLVINIS